MSPSSSSSQPLSETATAAIPTTMAGDDGNNDERMSIEQEQQQQLLRQQIVRLQEKCGRLEAQNILVAVQQLDLLARGIAFCLAVMCWYVYWNYIVAAVLAQDWSEAYRNIATSDNSCWSTLLFLAELPFLVVREVVAMPPWLGTACASCLAAIPMACYKVALFFLPLAYHYCTHGLAYRRLEVFAVFFIVLIRMKLCRWREHAFAAVQEEGATAATDGDNDGAGRRPPSLVIFPYGTKLTEDDIWEANYEISARFLYLSIRRLQGLWTKTAQYLSSRADFMPTAYVRELQKLQDAAPQTPWIQIQRTIPNRILNALMDLDENAMASASIGQCHAAKLKATGERVVVKVQHPSARTLLLDDLRSLLIFCRIIHVLEPDYGFLEVLMQEWASEARKELDFLQEAQNLRDAASSIGRMMQNRKILYTNAQDNGADAVPFQVEIPRTHDKLCTRNVLVMSFCEGCRIDDMDRIVNDWRLSPAAIMDGVAQAFAHMMYVSGPFNADPHSGNALVRPGTSVNDRDGFTIVLLDWGLAKRLPEKKRLAWCQMVYAAATIDFGLMLDSFKTIGLRMKRENVAEDMEGIRFLLREIVPRDTSRKRVKAKIRTDQQRFATRKKDEKIPMESKAYPGDFFFFVRVNELLHGLGSKFGIHLNYVDILKPYAERGLSEFQAYSTRLPQRRLVADKSRDVSLEQKVLSALEELKQMNCIAGAQICVLNKSGETLLDVVDGHLGGLKRQSEMRPDALILGYSCTKAVAATMAHIMVSEGYLTYDEPVCQRVWPSFCPSEEPPSELLASMGIPPADVQERWSWKRVITLRHILSHSSGMWSSLPPKLTIKSLADCEHCAAAFEYNSFAPEDTLLPVTAPGTGAAYHFLSFGWLIAGTLNGAYAIKNGLSRDEVTFEQVYETVLAPKLSKETIESGFHPCGGGDHKFPMAMVDTADISLSRIMQMQREAEAQGNAKEEEESEVTEDIRKSFLGKEFLLDPRIWNCEDGRRANVPAAGGRFSAKGLAMFYHDLGSGRIVDEAVLEAASAVVANETMANALQGQAVITSSGSDSEDSEGSISFGLGYQLIHFDRNKSKQPCSFGHAGVGGSIGFHHSDSGISVGVMLNKADADRSTSKRILHTIARHFDW